MKLTRLIRRRWVAPLVLLTLTAGVLCWSVVRGRELQEAAPWMKIGAAPLVGRDDRDSWDWRWSWGLAGAIAIAGAIAWLWHRGWWMRIRARWAALTAGVGAMVFATLLALGDGLDGLRYGIDHETEYLANLERTPPAAEFVSTYFEKILRYSTHVRGHPPGYELLLKLMAWAKLDGTWPVVALTVLATGVTAAGIVAIVALVVDGEWAKRCAPLTIVAPYALWMMSSADAVFAALAVIATLALLLSLHPRRLVGTAAVIVTVCLAVFAGLAYGMLLYMTYLGATLGLLPAVLLIAAARRGLRQAFVAGGATALGVALVVYLFWRHNFWWYDGVKATKVQYFEGTAKFRPWWYFGIANLAVAAVALGPLTITGFGLLRRRALWLIIAPVSAGLLFSHFSRYTKAETERIWLMFYPFLAIAGAATLTRYGRRRGAALITTQALCAIVLQASLVQKW